MKLGFSALPNYRIVLAQCGKSFLSFKSSYVPMATRFLSHAAAARQVVPLDHSLLTSKVHTL